MEWPHRDEVLKKHGVLPAQLAVLATAAYYIPLPWREFIRQAQAEMGMGMGLSLAEVAWGLRNCIGRGWVAMTLVDAVVPHRNVFVQLTGDYSMYAREGIVLTDRGHEIKNRIALDLFGEAYFASERVCSGRPPQLRSCSRA